MTEKGKRGPKRLLITGGAGFIGSHLCARFLDDGYEVICVENFLTGSRENLRAFERDARFHLVEHDVTEYIDISGPLESILHFASPASPRDYLELPIQTLKVGSLGTHKTLGLAKNKNARFLLASTSEVYGDPLVHPQREEYWGNVNPIGPRGVYDEAKRFAEAMSMAYHRAHRVDTRIARIFNTFGPGMRIDDGRAIPNFFAQAIREQDVTVFGAGSQTRSFCYVDDMVEGLTRLLRSSYVGPVNLGNPKELTILEVAEKVIALVGSSARIKFMPLPVDDPRVRQPDIGVAEEVLGWRPQVSIDDALNLTYGYFKKKIG